MANIERKRLLARIESLEERLSGRIRKRKSSEEILGEQIAQLEDVLGPGEDEEYFEEEILEGPVEEMDEILDIEALEEAPLDVELEEAPLDVEDELACLSCDEDFATMAADVGIENEITQDSLTEVEDEADSSVSTVEPKSAYMGRMKEASFRLDRVASYLEKHGKVKLAYRIDRLADAVDAQLSNAQ